VNPDAVALAVPPPADVAERLVGDAVASRIAAGDTTVWPRAARPGWVSAARGARPLVGEIEGLHERLRVAGLTRVVLAAAGGVGVAAEVIADAGILPTRLIVLDGTDPVQVADAVAGDLDATVLVVSAPPGEDTTAVELLWDTVATAFRLDGLDPDEHTVLVTAPDGPLLARAGGATTVLGPPDVDGPWAVLTAFAMVPAGLAGADVGVLLADALDTGPALAEDHADNPALAVGALLAQAPLVAVAGAGPLAEWVAQLLAGGLGKDGRGPLPVLVEAPDAPGWTAPGVLTVAVDGAGEADVTTDGPAAIQLLVWLYATAVAAHLLAVDPTDRPDARTPVMDAAAAPTFADGMVDVHAGDWLPPDTVTVEGALRALLDGTGTDHLAVHAYLDRHDDASAAVLRPELNRRTGLVTTFGWAPRCLPGSGQRDKGGPAGGVVCQVTGSGEPDEDDALGALQIGQARADAAALADRGRRVLRLHLTDRVVGLVTLVRAVQQL
jgi:glucose-6-phosphate isomerase